uniref:Uncharacterized protein n=1 Tax=Aegilops tauschii subsp. strangulata TaxID=200361 RepID=A0A453AQR2_AEGTS
LVPPEHLKQEQTPLHDPNVNVMMMVNEETLMVAEPPSRDLRRERHARWLEHGRRTKRSPKEVRVRGEHRIGFGANPSYPVGAYCSS